LDIIGISTTLSSYLYSLESYMEKCNEGHLKKIHWIHYAIKRVDQR